MSSYGGAPVFYDHQNIVLSEVSPSTVHSQNTQLVHYYKRYLLQKAMSVFKWKLPEHWNRDYLLYSLYCWGAVAVFNTDRFGVIPQMCGLGGYGVFYQPTRAIIANPLINRSIEARIGETCELLKLQPDFGGIMDMVAQYAELMAITSEMVSMNVVNSKLSYVFTSGNKAAAESFKKLYDKITSGEPAVVVDKALMLPDGSKAWEAFEQNLRQNFIAGDGLSLLRQIENQFATDIGIPNANTEKRERAVVDEINANNVETYSKCALWLESLQDGCERVKRMFGESLGGELAVDWRFQPVVEKPEDSGEVVEDEK